MNKYYIEARLMPTVLTMIPLVLLYIYYIAPLVSNVLEPVWDILPIFTGVAINTVVMFLLVLINRFISKVIFQKLFYQDDLEMPTTDYLYPNHKTLDKVSRARYYGLIMQDFNINMNRTLKSLQSDKEKRQMITRVVGQIREKLRDNKMLLQHNIEYGFWRNLLGGCVVASVVGIVLIILSKMRGDELIFITSCIMLVLYLLPIICSKQIVKYHGENYAKVLFEQYGCLERNDPAKGENKINKRVDIV